MRLRFVRTVLLLVPLAVLACVTLAACPAQAPKSTNPGNDNADPSMVVGFKYSHQGMMREPYYSIRRVKGGYECASTYSEIYWEEMDGADIMEYLDLSADGTYGYDDYSGRNPLGIGSGAKKARLTSEDMEEFTEILTSHGVFDWDGFDGHRTTPVGMFATDSGATFDLKVLRADGTVIQAHGVDVEPPNSDEAILAIFDFFERHGVSVY